MDFGIGGKVALVTGGSRGLGRQAALSLAGEGVNVAICGRTRETLDRTVREITPTGVRSIGIVADVSKTSTMVELYESVESTLGPIDILVNNAGGSISKTNIEETSLDEFKATFDLNVFGSFQLMKLVIPNLSLIHI